MAAPQTSFLLAAAGSTAGTLIELSFLEAQPMSVTRQLAQQIATLSATGREMHYLGVGYPNPEASDPRAYIEQANHYLGHLAQTRGVPRETVLQELHGYTDTLGPIMVRTNFAKVFGADLGMEIDPAHLIPSIGGTGGLDIVCSLFESGDSKLAYIVDAPTYAGFLTRAQRNPNARLYSVELEEDGPDPEALRAQIQQARDDGYFVAFYYTVPDGHNPGGISFSQEKRDAIYRVLRDTNIHMVEDNAYSYINYSDPTNRPKPFIAMDPDGRVIHIFTASKIGVPGPRVGFVHASGKIKVAGGATVNLAKLLVSSSAASILLHNPFSLMQFDAYLHDEELRLQPSLWPITAAKTAIYRENQGIFLAGMDHYLGGHPDLFSWTTAGAGFFSVFSLLGSEMQDALALAERLIQDDAIVTVPMLGFYSPDAEERNPGIGRNQLRLSFSYTPGTGDARRSALKNAIIAFGQTMRRRAHLSEIDDLE